MAVAYLLYFNRDILLLSDLPGSLKDVFIHVYCNKCNRRLIFVHFRRNKSDPDRRFNFDPFPHAEGDQDCTGWRCGE